MKKSLLIILVVISTVFVTDIFLTADEGIYTPDTIKYLQLDKKGLKIPVEKVFDPPNPGLYEAVLHMGATAEFVSSDGLMLTNHHVAFGSVAAMATAEKDYIKEGYLAKNKEEEVPARGYTGRIIKLYKNVTSQVLDDVTEKMTEQDRDSKIEENKAKILNKASNEYKDLEQIEVRDLYNGNRYYLMGYFVIRDVRIVYVPPRAIGEYGGDLDNWEWPRHTADFSFMRAYVSPDGKGVEYSEDNVPYKPRTWFQVDTKGTKEGDFVFVMGYPGRTYRYRDTYFIENELKSRLPFMIDLFGKQIDVVEAERAKDKNIEIAYAGYVKGRNNALKNYQNKVKFYKRVGLIEDKKKVEKEFMNWVNSDPERREKYGHILGQLKENRENIYKNNDLNNAIIALRSSNIIWNAVELKPNNRTDERTRNRILGTTNNIFLPLERHNLRFGLTKALELKGEQRFETLKEFYDRSDFEETVERLVEDILNNSVLINTDWVKKAFSMNETEFSNTDDILLKLGAEISKKTQSLFAYQNPIETELIRLNRIFTEGLMKFKESRGKILYPDANSTFRFTYGYVRGMTARDAVEYKPVTTLRGVIEKHTGQDPYNVPEKLRNAYKNRNFGRWANPAYDDVTVCLLTNTDTTGGNSGSPLINAEGHLIGCYFDRNYEGLTTDFKYQSELVRGISVDVRYILFLAELFGAGYLLDEMNVR